MVRAVPIGEYIVVKPWLWVRPDHPALPRLLRGKPRVTVRECRDKAAQGESERRAMQALFVRE